MNWLQHIGKDIMYLFTKMFLALIATLFMILSIFSGNTVYILISFLFAEIMYSLIAVDLITYYLYGLKKYVENEPENSKIIFLVLILIIFSPILAMVISFTGVAAIYGGLFIVTVVNRIKNIYQKRTKKKQKIFPKPIVATAKGAFSR
jgi:hypothetical protein